MPSPSSPTPEAWVDTAALLAQARAFEAKGAVRDAEAAYEVVIAAAARQGDQACLAQACRRRAVLAHQGGDATRARSGLQQSYAAAMLLGDRLLAAEALNTLGGLELETRNLAAAEAALVEAADLAGDDPAVLARVSQNLGIVANIRGDHPAADAHYHCSLAAYEARGDAHGSAIARHNLGMLAADRGEPEQASAHYEACERLAESAGDLHLRALCLVNHAEVMIALGRTPDARAALETAARTFVALEARFDEADVQRVLGLCDQADGLLRHAESHLVQARELAHITDARLTEAEAARDLGRLYAQTGRPAQARSALREAVLRFEGLGAASEAAATRRELALLDGASSGPAAAS